MDLHQIAETRDKLTRLQQKRDRSAGALEQVTKQLKKDHGCKDEESALKLVEKLKREASKQESDYEVGIKKFNEKYADKLE